MNLTRLLLSVCALASSVVCISAYSMASSEPSVSFTAVKPCSKETAPKPKVEILDPLGPLHDIVEPDILEAFKSRVGAMKTSGEYDRRFNQNKDRIAKELEHPTPVAALKKATELRVWELSASVPETLPESLLRQAQSVPMPHLSRSLLFIDGADSESIEVAQKLYQSQKDMRVVLVKGAPAEVSQKLNRRVFFDQGGALVRVFGIEALPALLFNGPEGPTGTEFAPDQLSELLSLMPQP
ncbi:conjugal transfer protein TraW [Parasutterella excrementihominis]|uniref:conjugal transfer protein TraW n=1 Tax=Parasutterella excrementihominis TaxID=487175 RepID=UPI003FED603E